MTKVMQTIIANNHSLNFVQIENDDKLLLQSDDPEVQAWINTVRRIRVRDKDIPYVIKAFRKAFRSGDPVEYAQRQKQEKVSLERVADLNRWAQKWYGAPPCWEVTTHDEDKKNIWSEAVVALPGGALYRAKGASQRKAKAVAADLAWEGIDTGEFIRDSFDHEVYLSMEL